MTTGGIVSAPAVGTNGTIIWAPGRIDAFSFAQLEYDLSIVPKVSDTRVVITGTPTPASGGTTAIYVDETCSRTLPASPAPCSTALQLAGATHTLGPLCELAVTVGTSLATRAVVDDLRAYGTRRGVMVEWTTLAEHGTVGFHLLRLNAESGEYERVNDQLLPGLLHSRHGGTYRYRDARVEVGEMHTYKLVEVEANGNRLEYGPYPVIVAKNRKRAGGWSRSVADAPLANLERAPRARPEVQKARRKARKKARLKARLARHKRRAATAKITIEEPGLYYLDAARIGEILGLRTARVRRLIGSQRLSMSNRGEPVATAAARGNRGLYFYGEAVGGGKETRAPQDRRDDIYTQENVYLLRRGRGLPMGVVDGGRPEPVAGRHFRDTVQVEGNKYTVTHLFDDPDGDYWMWDFRIGGLPLSDCDAVGPGMPCYISEYPLPSPAVVDYGDADATLTVRLHGGTQTADAVDHRVSVSLNGRPLGNAEWDGTIAHTARFTFPASLLLDAGNSVAVDAAPSGDPDMPSVVYVNDITLDYPRAFSARAQSLLMPATGSRTQTVDGFHSETVRVFDLADPKRPARVVNTTIDGRPGNYRVSFVAGQQPRNYLAIDPGDARAPLSIIADEPSRLRSRRHRVDYLIISADEMLDAAEVRDGRLGDLSYLVDDLTEAVMGG